MLNRNTRSPGIVPAVSYVHIDKALSKSRLPLTILSNFVDYEYSPLGLQMNARYKLSKLKMNFRLPNTSHPSSLRLFIRKWKKENKFLMGKKWRNENEIINANTINRKHKCVADFSCTITINRGWITWAPLQILRRERTRGSFFFVFDGNLLELWDQTNRFTG